MTAVGSGETGVGPDAGQEARVARGRALNRETVKHHLVRHDLDGAASVVDGGLGSAAGPSIDASLRAEQGEGLGDLNLLVVEADGHVDRVAGRGLRHGGGDSLTRAR